MKKVLELNDVHKNFGGIRAMAGVNIEVYENEIVGDFVADIIVNDTIILELKSVRQIIKAHEVQLVNYLVATR